MSAGQEPSARALDSCYHPDIQTTRGTAMDKEGSQLIRGLEGVVAAETQLCDLDGVNGRLAYRGYDIADLARQATFGEVAYLLWHSALPRRADVDRLHAEPLAARPLPERLVAAHRLL